MNITLREKIELEITKMKERIVQLDRHIAEYVNVGNLADAAINQIKRNTLTLVIDSFDEILRNHK